VRLIADDITRQLIDDEIRSARYPEHDPARWALPLLDMLAPPGASWTLVELDANEYGGLWLPAHRGEACHGDAMSLGGDDRGGTVATRAAWLDGHAETYAAANPSCWSRLERARVAGPTAIVIARHSVGDRVKPDEAALVVVDGLHRALAGWRRGDRSCRAYLASPSATTAPAVSRTTTIGGND